MAIAVLIAGTIGALFVLARYQSSQAVATGDPAPSWLGVIGGEISAASDQISSELQTVSGEFGLSSDPIELALPIIKQFEGFSASAYPDPPGSGKYSIGYGHQIRPTDPYDQGSVISESEASDLCRVDVGGAYACVSDNVNVQLQPQQIAALISFCFNVGCGAFRSSTMLRLVNQGDFEGAAAQFPQWIHSGGGVNAGLVARRQQEADLFLS